MQEAQRILDVADQNKVVLKLFGGMAVRCHCPSASDAPLKRECADIDLMGLTSQSRRIQKLFVELGYSPREIFNTFQGNSRLIFNDLENGRRVDIFLDVFEMCHRFKFKHRLSIDKMTISLADLLATKLQVVEITHREYKDIMALVHDHAIGDSDSMETINGKYLADLCPNDWGIYKTFTANISKVLSEVSQYQLTDQYQGIVRDRLQDLQTRIENTPKTLRWRLRARVGENKQWYTLPEKDEKVVDSHFST